MWSFAYVQTLNVIFYFFILSQSICASLAQRVTRSEQSSRRRTNNWRYGYRHLVLTESGVFRLHFLPGSLSYPRVTHFICQRMQTGCLYSYVAALSQPCLRRRVRKQPGERQDNVRGGLWLFVPLYEMVCEIWEGQKRKVFWMSQDKPLNKSWIEIYGKILWRQIGQKSWCFCVVAQMQAHSWDAGADDFGTMSVKLGLYLCQFTLLCWWVRHGQFFFCGHCETRGRKCTLDQLQLLWSVSHIWAGTCQAKT